MNTRNSKISSEIRQDVIYCLLAGFSLEQIARKHNIPRSTIASFINRSGARKLKTITDHIDLKNDTYGSEAFVKYFIIGCLSANVNFDSSIQLYNSIYTN